MKANIKTSVIRCEGRKYNGYHYHVSVFIGDFELIYITQEEDREVSRACLTSIFCNSPRVYYSYNRENGDFWRVNGDQIEPETLQELATMAEGLPIIYPEIPAELQAGEVVKLEYSHELQGDEPKTGAGAFAVFVTNLGRYNEGALVGAWLTLPATDDEIQKTLDRIGINEFYEEFFITDTENMVDGLTFSAGEWDSLEELNDLAERIDDLNSWDQEALAVLVSEGFGDLEESLQIVEDNNYIYWGDCENMEDVARRLIDETGELDQIGGHLAYYFDFRAYGRDLELEGQFYEGDGCYIEVIR